MSPGGVEVAYVSRRGILLEYVTASSTRDDMDMTLLTPSVIAGPRLSRLRWSCRVCSFVLRSTPTQRIVQCTTMFVNCSSQQ
jgi:hypothetical protein